MARRIVIGNGGLWGVVEFPDCSLAAVIIWDCAGPIPVLEWSVSSHFTKYEVMTVSVNIIA